MDSQGQTPVWRKSWHCWRKVSSWNFCVVSQYFFSGEELRAKPSRMLRQRQHGSSSSRVYPAMMMSKMFREWCTQRVRQLQETGGTDLCRLRCWSPAARQQDANNKKIINRNTNKKKRKQEIKNSGSNGSMHPRLTCSGHFWWGHCSAARHECWPMCGNWLDYPMMNESAPCGRHGILMPLTVKVSWKSSKWVEVVVLEKRRQFNHDLTGLSMGWAKLHLHIHTCVHIHMLCLLYILTI